MPIGQFRWYEYLAGYIFIGLCIFLAVWVLIAILKSFWDY